MRFVVSTLWLRVQGNNFERRLRTIYFEDEEKINSQTEALGEAIKQYGIDEGFTKEGFTLELYESFEIENNLAQNSQAKTEEQGS